MGRVSPQARLRAEAREEEVAEIIDTGTVDLTETHDLIRNYRQTIEQAGRAGAEAFSNKTREYMADNILYALETAEREAAERQAAERTREEWKALEAAQVTRRHDREDYETATAHLLRKGRITKKQAAWAQNRLRECQAWNCEAVFVSTYGAKYCCQACEREQNAAKTRLRKTGTYLNREMYIPKRSESIEKARKQHEVSLDAMSTDDCDIYEVIDEHGTFATEHKSAPLIRDLVDAEMRKYAREGRI